MDINKQLFSFLKKSPTAYHAVNTVKEMLLENGFEELFENAEWKLSDSGKYFVIRNGSSIIAFCNRKNKNGFMITASHSDSPAFRLKMTPESIGAYTRLEVEKYGGMIYYSWLDRPLSLAGRVVVRTENGIETNLVNIDRDIAVIPSLAIHMNRGVNESCKLNPAVDLLPLASSKNENSKGSVTSEIAKELSIAKEDIISHDIFLYNREAGRVVGINGEYIMAPRLDDLECVFASLKAFTSASESDSVPVLAVFDNEEVGSETKQGAASTFLSDVLERISGARRAQMLASSFMVSADNAHAVHPNHPELSDSGNAPKMNGGIVIKWNANQKYTTDGISDAVFREICGRCGAAVQSYCNRADLVGGATLGSISNTKVSIPTVDIGLAQLAMHSAVETAGAEDISELVLALREFYQTSLERDVNGIKF